MRHVITGTWGGGGGGGGERVGRGSRVWGGTRIEGVITSQFGRLTVLRQCSSPPVTERLVGEQTVVRRFEVLADGPRVCRVTGQEGCESGKGSGGGGGG